MFVLLGASGDVSRKKIYPTLWRLYRDSLLPDHTVIVGYARSQLTVEQMKEKCRPYMKVQDEECYQQFWKMNHYLRGSYDNRQDFELLHRELIKLGTEKANRIFYLALPPSVFQIATFNLKAACMADEDCWTRVIIEKPFGRDSESSDQLSRHLAQLYTEEQLYRIDHYLGKEMVQNLTSVR